MTSQQTITEVSINSAYPQLSQMFDHSVSRFLLDLSDSLIAVVGVKEVLLRLKGWPAREASAPGRTCCKCEITARGREEALSLRR